MEHRITQNAGPRPVALVVDDNVEVCVTLEAILEDAGYEVVTAYSEEAAVRSLPAGGKLDLLVADVTLRNGNGASLAKRVLEARPETTIILMSGWSTVDESTFPPGARFLRKPFRTEQLLEAIKLAEGAKKSGSGA